MNQFPFSIQNNPINNIQPGYPNFIGNMPNQYPNMNNINYNNFNNFQNINSEKQFYFCFMNAQSFKIKAKLNEKLIDIINNFKNKECPNGLKNSLNVCIIHAEKIKDFNKALYEFNIKDNDRILFIDSPTEFEENKGDEDYVLTER